MEFATLSEHTAMANGVAPASLILDRVRSYVVMMTPSQAQFIVDTQMWPRQRNLRRAHSAYLASAIQTGELWKLTLEFAELPDGTKMLIDGQHRLDALIQTKATLPAVVIVSRVADDRGVAELYASIDRQATRSMSDALRAYAIVTESHVNVNTLNKLSAGVAILSARFVHDYSARTRSLVARAREVEDWLSEIETYVGWLTGNTKESWNLLTRSAVSAVALATIREQPDMAEQFWRAIANDDGLKKGEPAHTLLIWLRANPTRVHPNAIVYAQYVATAWNHFYDGGDIDKLIVRNKQAPVRIMGTRITGRAGRDDSAAV
jgi:hypothetical protein